MIDKRIFHIIMRWEELSWLERKHLCWLSFWTKRRIGPREIITAIVFLSVMGVLIEENHDDHRIMLLAFLALFYFYALILDYYYRHRRASYQ